MAIIAPQTAPNFATGDYFRILKEEVLCSPGEPLPRKRVLLGFYASAAARDANTDPMYVYSIDIPFCDALPDPRPQTYAALMLMDLFANTNARSDEAPAEPVVE